MRKDFSVSKNKVKQRLGLKSYSAMSIWNASFGKHRNISASQTPVSPGDTAWWLRTHLGSAGEVPGLGERWAPGAALGKQPASPLPPVPTGPPPPSLGFHSAVRFPGPRCPCPRDAFRKALVGRLQRFGFQHRFDAVPDPAPRDSPLHRLKGQHVLKDP